MKELVEVIAKALVDDPESVTVNERTEKKTTILEVRVADSRSKRDGKCIAEIGTYDPNIEPSAYKVNEEEAKKWLAAGAQPTDVVARIFKEAGIEK